MVAAFFKIVGILLLASVALKLVVRFCDFLAHARNKRIYTAMPPRQLVPRTRLVSFQVVGTNAKETRAKRI
jgi:hypothetical protein